jgi:hypothetical protein
MARSAASEQWRERHTTTHVHGVVVVGHCTHRSSRCTYAVHACSAAGCVVERLACHVALAMNGAQKKDTVTSYDVGERPDSHTHTSAPNWAQTLCFVGLLLSWRSPPWTVPRPTSSVCHAGTGARPTHKSTATAKPML